MRWIAASLAAWWLTATIALAAETASVLELRKMTDQGLGPERTPIPAEAVRVFAHEGTPWAIRVTDRQIAVDYGRSGVLFDRDSGQLSRRITSADGWPQHKPEQFAAAGGWQRPPMVGPGVVNIARRAGILRPGEQPEPPTAEVAAEVQFDGRTWRAYHPAGFITTIERPQYVSGQPRPPHPTWSEALERLNESCYVEAGAGGGAAAKKFTMADGLASNIVTDLAVCGDTLWAACVDIYDRDAEQWGPGGLCRYDSKSGRWQRVERIGGRPVRWVTLLRAVGDELWVGFRDGKGVVGDEIRFGMGVYPGIYRPETSAIVLAHWADGRWASFAREPLPEFEPTYAPAPNPATKPVPSTEHPVELARLDDKVLLFTHMDAHRVSGSWNKAMSGHVWLLTPGNGKWRLFDRQKDLNGNSPKSLVFEQGEVLIGGSRGVLRFDPDGDRWQSLDSQSPIRNAVFHTAAVAGEQLWLGYAMESYESYGPQGISRFDETTGRWSYMPPEQLGTASPVRRIVALPSGEVWVLFGRRPYFGAMASPAQGYADEWIPRPTGLGRLAEGKWEFPLPGPPAPERRPFESVQDDLAAMGNRLVLARPTAVWSGPEPWKEVLQGEVVKFEPAGGKDTIEIICRPPKTDDEEGPEYKRWLYRLVDGQPRLDEAELPEDWPTSVDLFAGMMGPSIIEGGWATFALAGSDDRWAAFNTASGTVGLNALVSASAVWIFDRGEVIRLDRRVLADLAGTARRPAR